MGKRTLFVGSAICAMVVSGCGSTTDSEKQGASGGGAAVPAAVKDLVAEAGRPAPWAGPTASPPMLEDKFVVIIPCSMASPGCVRWVDGVEAAAKVFGWRTQVIDPVFDINKMNQAFEQAVNLNADAIVTTVIDPSWVPQALAKARSEGIVVLGGAIGYENDPTTADGFNHIMSLHGETQGEWVAAQACYDANAQGQALIVTDPTFNILNQRVDAMQAYLSKNCPDISVQVEQVSSQDVGTALQNKVSAFVQRNPDLDALLSPVDLYATDIITSLKQLGKTDIGVYSIDGDENIVQNIAEGGPVVATVGSALEWEGWATIDEVNRLLQGEPALDDDGVPGRMITKDYIPDGFAYRGDLDYEAMFKQLWETGSLQP